MEEKAKHRNRRAAALLAIVAVGMFAICEFDMGSAEAGVPHLIALRAAALLPSAMGIQLPFTPATISPCVEGVIYALKIDAQLDGQHVYGKRAFL